MLIPAETILMEKSKKQKKELERERTIKKLEEKIPAPGGNQSCDVIMSTLLVVRSIGLP